MKTTLSIFIAGLLLTACTQQPEEKVKTETSDLSSVSVFSEDVSPEKAMKYRKDYRSRDFLKNGDVGNYSFLNVPEFYQTATVYRGAGQVAILEEAIDESLLNTLTDTDAGKMPLKDL